MVSDIQSTASALSIPYQFPLSSHCHSMDSCIEHHQNNMSILYIVFPRNCWPCNSQNQPFYTMIYLFRFDILFVQNTPHDYQYCPNKRYHLDTR